MFQQRELDYYGVTVEKESITAVTPSAYLESLTTKRRLAKEKLQAAEEDQYAFCWPWNLTSPVSSGTKRHQVERLYSNSQKTIFIKKATHSAAKYLGEFFGLERDNSLHLDRYGEPMFNYAPNIGGLNFYVKGGRLNRAMEVVVVLISVGVLCIVIVHRQILRAYFT
ncbi:hypothetical protein THAOC_15244 [Thalassiosira oceanica]|uniref:Uncharacterized protein n=1 Tax=Thalassiosira oceanica TaxID=159749 RepID=K0SGE2_THAOC|nr:hypothetical protein THAOC_15244 [Thalassiosira oceanica]|eukprot:EJK64059.1 hypothetical protein THAOC_15244 [Thalassiosira oceanica]